MKIMNQFLIGLLVFILCTPLSANGIHFNSIDLVEAQNLAKKEGKKVYVNFTAEWCLPCKIISESIYTDPEVTDLINSNFIAIDADIDSENGIVWNELYNANYLPTIILARKSGHEITRISKVPKKQELITILNKVIEENREEKEEVVKIIKPVETKKIATPSNLYDIQLGAFAHEKNAIKYFNEMKAKLPSDSFRILKKGSKNLYCVLLTGFDKRSLTNSKLADLSSMGINGFVIEY